MSATFPTSRDLVLARRLLRVLKEAGEPMKRTDVKAAIGLSPRHRKPNEVLRVLAEAGLVLQDFTGGGVRWKFLRMPADGELRVAPRERDDVQVSELIATLGRVDLDERRAVALQQRARDASRFLRLVLLVRGRDGEERPTRRFLNLQDGDLELLAEFLDDMAAEAEGGHK